MKGMGKRKKAEAGRCVFEFGTKCTKDGVNVEEGEAEDVVVEGVLIVCASCLVEEVSGKVFTVIFPP